MLFITAGQISIHTVRSVAFGRLGQFEISGKVWQVKIRQCYTFLRLIPVRFFLVMLFGISGYQYRFCVLGLFKSFLVHIQARYYLTLRAVIKQYPIKNISKNVVFVLFLPHVLLQVGIKQVI